MSKKYDFATKQEVDDLAEMVRRFVAEQTARSDRAVADMRERYADVVQIVNEANRMTRDAIDLSTQANVGWWSDVNRRLVWFEDRTLRGRWRRVRRWVRVRWYYVRSLLTQDVDRD